VNGPGQAHHPLPTRLGKSVSLGFSTLAHRSKEHLDD
jgi:hypothetical protein